MLWRQLSGLPQGVDLVVVVFVVVDVDVTVVADSPNWLWAGVGVCAAVCGEDEERAVEGSAQDQPPLHGDASHVVVGVQTLRDFRGGSRISIFAFWRMDKIVTWINFCQAKSTHHAAVVFWVGDWTGNLQMQTTADYFSYIVTEILHVWTTWSMSYDLAASSRKLSSLRSSTGPTIQYPVPFMASQRSDM